MSKSINQFSQFTKLYIGSYHTIIASISDMTNDSININMSSVLDFSEGWRGLTLPGDIADSPTKYQRNS